MFVAAGVVVPVFRLSLYLLVPADVIVDPLPLLQTTFGIVFAPWKSDQPEIE